MAKPTQPTVSGILPVLKTPGPTSHDVVQIARRALKERQIGHTGTLDPAAGGLLVLCLGTYTKLVPYLTESDKVYRGWIALGAETDTDDAEGSALQVPGAHSVEFPQVQEAVRRFVGEIDQVPPRYAAVKVAGKKLYEYAREGKQIEVPARRVHVYSFDVEEPEAMEVPPQMRERVEPKLFEGKALRKVAFVTEVSSGTYVRALARDLGRVLGCGGFLLSLWRECSGVFCDSEAMPLEMLRSHPERAREYMRRGAGVLDANRFPVLRLIGGFRARLENGQPLNEKMMENAGVAAAVPSGAVCAVTGEEGTLLALMQAERFDAQRLANAYDSRFEVHFRPLRIFPGGLG